MISTVLVANRGEIARRVFATCRRLGIRTVAVYSDADANLPHVRDADVAVRLPGDAPSDTYLRTDLILAAAAKTGADAIHPGYGFLSENADFARAVEDAGITWIGPAPMAIDTMGSKVTAKQLMKEAGVPVLDNIALDRAVVADLPLLVKASAGGGGRGMRVVRELDALPNEVAQAEAEAKSAFGDGTVFVEAYVEHGRHVEVQVVGTESGVLVFGERDCSVQRRHQKVIEEAPAPGLTDASRTALHEAARNAAAAIDYRGAGTVEFLVDATDTNRFWFLEMNTRLQVEHPVTEAIYGVDLVELQLAVAEGSPIGLEPTSAAPLIRSESPSLPAFSSVTSLRHTRPGPDRADGLPAVGEPSGHAIEVRLYAEDPAQDWQPQSGTLSAFDIPGVVAEFTPDNVRVDAGFAAGSEVSTHYDAMLAKVIVHAPTRTQAVRRLAGVLERATVHGLVTNRDLLVEILRHPAFAAGEMTTSFFANYPEVVEERPIDEVMPFVAAVAVTEAEVAARTTQRGIPAAWRNVVSQPQVTRFARREETFDVQWYATRDGYQPADREGMGVLAASPDEVTVEVDGVATTYGVTLDGDQVSVQSPSRAVTLTRLPRFVDPADQVASGSLLAPMPGTVVTVAVEAGASVAAGDTVLVLEAMKMQHTITAPHDGVVTDLPAAVGVQVAASDVLAVVEESE